MCIHIYITGGPQNGFLARVYYARGRARRSPQKKRIFTMIEFTDQHLLIFGIVLTLVLLLDDPARSLLLIALSPFWSALLGLILLGDPLPLRTRWALVFSFIAIGIVLAPRVISVSPASSDEILGSMWHLSAYCAFDSTPHAIAATHETQSTGLTPPRSERASR